MSNHTASLRVATLLLCASPLFVWGCSKKGVSSSGDEFAAVDDKSKPGAVETIKPDRMATVPDDRRPPIESSRSQFDSGTSPAPPSPGASGGFAAPSAGGFATDSTTPSVAESGGLTDVFFDFDQFTLRNDARSALESNAKWLKSASVKSVLIEGHCDERGTEAYNLVLGEKRAKSAKRYLEDLGVAASRLKVVSYGKTRPFCKERDEVCYQQNRRAHFVIR